MLKILSDRSSQEKKIKPSNIVDNNVTRNLCKDMMNSLSLRLDVCENFTCSATGVEKEGQTDLLVVFWVITIMKLRKCL